MFLVRIVLLVILALSLAGRVGAQPLDAKQTFELMETKLLQAKTLKCTLELTEEGHKDVSMKGQLLLGDGNKFRLDLKTTVNNEAPKEYAEASDGTHLEIKTPVATTAHKPSKHLGENWRVYLARSGVYLPMLFSHNATDAQVSKDIQVSDIKLGKPEAFAGKQATVLHYLLKEKNEKLKVSVWLDPTIMLPLKREMKFADNEKSVRFVEIYSDWSVDQKQDEKQFTLPPPQPPDAKETFEQMEKKLLNAKTLKCSINSTLVMTKEKNEKRSDSRLRLSSAPATRHAWKRKSTPVRVSRRT